MIYTWHKVKDHTASGLPENKMQEIEVAEKKIVLLRRDKKVYAFAANCPHAGTPLCEGWINPQGLIVCSTHLYRFDPTNGRNTSGEGYKLVTYPVEIKNDEIIVGILS